MAIGFYTRRAARLLPPPPGRAPQTQKQIQFLHPLRTHTLQPRQGDTMNPSNANAAPFLDSCEEQAYNHPFVTATIG